MSPFDSVIGYRSIKEELERTAGILRNASVYEAAGARIPTGMLIHGNPGVGKSLMSECFIEASGLPAFTCRKDMPDGEFVAHIRKLFDDAIAAVPCIVFMDDLDKFANTDVQHRNADAYVTVQACIDQVRGTGVFVLATANDLTCLPSSLVRAGRFDRKVHVPPPRGRDAEEIMRHYLRGRSLAGITPEDVAMLMDGRSCAVLETVLNEALIYSVGREEDAISRGSFMDAYFAQEIAPPPAAEHDEITSSENGERRRISVHEAGHAVVYEVLSGRSVALATAFRQNDHRGGVCLCRRPPDITSGQWNRVRTYAGLGGRAAADIVFGVADEGALDDLARVHASISQEITAGTVFGIINPPRSPRSNGQESRQELDLLTTAELERRYQRTKELLASNRLFLDKLADAIYENDYLVSSDIQAIKAECEIVRIAV